MKRKIYAVAVMLAISIFAGALLGQTGAVSSQLQPAIVGLVAAALGGFVARAQFMFLALLVHAFIWLLILYMLHGIGRGQSTYLVIASYNVFAISASFVLVVLGAYLGQWLSTRSGSRTSAAA